MSLLIQRQLLKTFNLKSHHLVNILQTCPFPEVRASYCSRLGKLGKPQIISVSIGVISILAILAAVSIWLYTRKRLEHNLITDERYTPGLIHSEALIPGDCSDVYRAGRTESGVYNLTLRGQTVGVYCDMEKGGGWTVFHNRMDGSVDFYKTWKEYKAGFGDLEGEFWWGNDHLATVTGANRYALRVDMSHWNGDTAYALYTNFSVAAESDNYTLTAEGYTGTLEIDPLLPSNGQAFSTKDRDNDNWHSHSVKHLHTAGWYGQRAWANPNGRYGGRREQGHDMMYWGRKGAHRPLKSMSMKLRATAV